MSQHPNSLANLKPPWKPGESGNPNGRPSYRQTFEHMVQRLSEEIPEGEERTNLEALARKAWQLAIAGDDKLLPVVLDRVWPKVSKHELEASVSGVVALVGEAEWVDLTSAADRLQSNGKSLPQGKRNGGDAAGDPS